MYTPHITRRRLLTGTAAGTGAALGAPALWAAADSNDRVTIVAFEDSGDKLGRRSVTRVSKSEDAWRKQLSARAYRITREQGTEDPFSGKYYKVADQRGIYRCVCCDNALYDSKTQFHSGTGWPSFWQPIAEINVTENRDTSFGMVRIEIACTRCAAHLGHKFHDGPEPTGLRYCMDSVALTFHPIKSA